MWDNPHFLFHHGGVEFLGYFLYDGGTLEKECAGGEIGRRTTLRWERQQWHGSSNLLLRTNKGHGCFSTYDLLSLTYKKTEDEHSVIKIIS